MPAPPAPTPAPPAPTPGTPTQGFHTKFTAGAIGSAISLIVITELNRRGITIDGNEGAAITALASGILAWLAPSLPSD